MRKQVLFLFFLSLVLNMHGQEQTLEEEITELGIPSYPAMSLMGILPQEITRPKSLDQLEATLINSFTGEGSFAIPRNFAMEIMPYWLKSHPYKEFSYDELLKNEFAPLENLALSLGTSNQSLNDSVFSSRIGFGARTLIFSGKVSKPQLDSLNRFVRKFRLLSYSEENLIIVMFTMQNSGFATYRAFFDTAFSELRKSMAALDGDRIEKEIVKAENFFAEFVPRDQWDIPVNSPLTVQKLADSIINQIDAKLNDKEFTSLAAEIQKVQARKTGLLWEVAASTFLEFPEGDFNYSTVPKLGAWSTLSYIFPPDRFGLSAMVRYIRDFQTESGTTDLDFGGSAFYQTNKITFAAEFLQRYQESVIERTIDQDGFNLNTTRTRYEYRTSVNVSYRLSQSMVIAYTFGKAFSTTDSKVSGLVNQLSLNFGLGNVPLKF